MSPSVPFATEPELVEVDGVKVPAAFGDWVREVRAIRSSVGLSWRNDVARLRLGGADAWEVLGRVCPTTLFMHDAQLRHTLLLDEHGALLADLYVGSDDDAFLLLSEGLAASALRAHVLEHAPAGAHFEIVDLGETHSALGLDGPFAWEALAALEGPDVVGFPFHTFYHPAEAATYVRAGKTGEYGYLLLVPHAEAAALWSQLLALSDTLALREVGVRALWHARFENWFFNIHREGRVAGLGPVELGLQWRLSGDDRDWVGRSALRARQATHRTVALVGAGPLAAGAPIRYGSRSVGTVLVAEESVSLDLPIAMGLVERALAHSGIDRFRAGDVPVRTVSAPFVNNLSLYVSPQRHSWASRDQVGYPGARPPGIVAP